MSKLKCIFMIVYYYNNFKLLKIDFNELKNYINNEEDGFGFDYKNSEDSDMGININNIGLNMGINMNQLGLNEINEKENIQKQIETLENSFKENPLNYETLYKLIYLYKDTKNSAPKKIITPAKAINEDPKINALK